MHKLFGHSNNNSVVVGCVAHAYVLGDCAKLVCVCVYFMSDVGKSMGLNVMDR